MSKIDTHKITISPVKADNRGQPYAVTYEGQTIIAKSHVPSHDACRYLVARGLTGSLEVYSADAVSPRLTVKDIVKAAKWTVSEGLNHGPRFARYVPFDREAFMARVEAEADAP